MQLDVDIEPTFTFSYMKCIDKQKDITMKQLNKLFLECRETAFFIDLMPNKNFTNLHGLFVSSKTFLRVAPV